MQIKKWVKTIHAAQAEVWGVIGYSISQTV